MCAGVASKLRTLSHSCTHHAYLAFPLYGLKMIVPSHPKYSPFLPFARARLAVFSSNAATVDIAHSILRATVIEAIPCCFPLYNAQQGEAFRGNAL
jgi:hypothetical protein